MTVWFNLLATLNKRRKLQFAGFLMLLVALITTQFFATTTYAIPNTTKTINFQGRLLKSSGAVVADGNYNMQFKIYQDGSGTATGNPDGSLKWTESHTTGASQAIEVRNGFFSVSLGSVNTFGTSVDWNQDTLWLSMNVAGSAAGCSTFGSAPCTADGEMLPMKRITATPYSLNSGALDGKTADDFVQLGQGKQTDSSDETSIAINKTGAGDLIQLQSNETDSFTVNNAGSISLGSTTNQTISVATSTSGAGKSLTVSAGSAATASNLNGGDVVLQAGAGDGTGTSGNVIVRANGSDNSGTFQVQNTSSQSLLTANTADMSVTINGSLSQTGTKLKLAATLPGGPATNYPRAIDIVGKYAYVASQGTTGNFGIIDITNPTKPSTVGVLSDPLLNFARDVRVAGRYAYVVTFSDVLVVIDVSNASSPTVVGSLESEYLNDAHGLEIQGGYAYVAADLPSSPAGYFTVVDISKPTKPQYVTSLSGNEFGDAKRVAINGSYAYVTSGLNTGGLTVVDISNPKNPVKRGNITSNTLLSLARNVKVRGKYAYVVGASSNSLVIIDVSNPDSLSIVGSVTSATYMNEAFDLTLNGDYAYVSGRSSDSIAVVNISNPTAPSLDTSASYVSTGLMPSATMLKGGYLYMIANSFSITESRLTVLSTGGTNLGGTTASSLSTGSLQVDSDAGVAGTLNVQNGIIAGQGGVKTDGTVEASGLRISGASSLGGNTTIKTQTDNTTAFSIQNASSASVLNVSTSSGNILTLGSGNGGAGHIGHVSDGVYAGSSASSRSSSFNKSVPVGHTIIGSLTVDYVSSLVPLTVTDSAGNTYTVDSTAAHSSAASQYIFSGRVTNALSSSDTLTLTLGGTGIRWAWNVEEFDNIIASSRLDAVSGNNDASSLMSSGTTATTTDAHELVFGGFSYTSGGGRTITPGSGFSNSPQQATTTGSADRSNYVQWKYVDNAGTQTSTAISSPASTWAAAVATYRTSGERGIIGSLGLAAGNGFTGSINTSSLTANRTYSLPDEDGTICLQGSTDCGFLLNQTGAVQAGGFNIGGTGKISSDSANAFTVQSASSVSQFNIDNANNRITIGISDTTGTLLVLDTKTSSGDPTGASGAMYYNSDAGRFRCYEDGKWKDCITPLPVSATANSDTANSTTTPKDVDDLSFSLAKNTKYYYKFVAMHQSSATSTGIGFGVTTPSSPVSNHWCANTSASLSSATPGTWGAYCGTGDASATTNGVPTAGATTYTSTVEGYIETDSNGGTLKLRMKSGEAAQATVKAGSFGVLQVMQ